MQRSESSGWATCVALARVDVWEEIRGSLEFAGRSAEERREGLVGCSGHAGQSDRDPPLDETSVVAATLKRLTRHSKKPHDDVPDTDHPTGTTTGGSFPGLVRPRLGNRSNDRSAGSGRVLRGDQLSYLPDEGMPCQ